MKTSLLLIALGLGAVAFPAWSKLPPLSDEAKAKAAEIAAKTGWTSKIAEHQLCMAGDRVAAVYLAQARQAGKDVKPTATPPCTEPGPFTYTPTAEPRPIEAAGAHSPAATATGPPSTMVPAAITTPTPAKK